MNLLDVVLLALLILVGISGYRRGLALQAFGFGGLLVGLLVGALLAPLLATLVDAPAAQAGVAAAVLITLAGAGNAVGWMLGTRARERTQATRLRSADAAGGSMLAIVASLLAIWLLALNLSTGPLPTMADQIRGSAIVRTLDAALPAPPSLLAQARRFLGRLGFPDVFSGIPPMPAAPVEPPSQVEARSAVEAGAASTVRVIGRACDAIQEGSAFVVADGYVVTNAHVVAGVTDPQVQSTGIGSESAITVLFDPELDLALLFVEETPGSPLSLAAEAPERGAAGAVLGYPGGGPLDARRAAVRRTIEAVGRDIYGHGEVERLVLELQTRVRPGSSGGPFVLSDGRVGGVVFAASSGDEDVGYAIAAPELQETLREGLGATAEVDTGPCIP
ncbi:MAG TPA: MarP family serine protease [Actinomycetota bacterium]|nr:MarP family serine protease [Actinomycetota bacterium]